jgi:hypothetical protein
MIDVGEENREQHTCVNLQKDQAVDKNLID